MVISPSCPCAEALRPLTFAVWRHQAPDELPWDACPIVAWQRQSQWQALRAHGDRSYLKIFRHTRINLRGLHSAGRSCKCLVACTRQQQGGTARLASCFEGSFVIDCHRVRPPLQLRVWGCQAMQGNAHKRLPKVWLHRLFWSGMVGSWQACTKKAAHFNDANVWSKRNAFPD